MTGGNMTRVVLVQAKLDGVIMMLGVIKKCKLEDLPGVIIGQNDIY